MGYPAYQADPQGQWQILVVLNFRYGENQPMKTGITPYQVVNLSAGRRMMVSANDLYWQKHCLYGLLEVDVTVARQFIQEVKAQIGEQLSFTGFLAYCLARAVDEDKTVQAYKKGRKQLVVFDNVDVMIMIEHKAGENRGLMGHMIQGANHKTYREIHQEIRRVQSELLPPTRGMPSWFRSALLLPWPLPKLVKALLEMVVRRDPTIFTSMAGTVGISSVGMFGKSLGVMAAAPLAGWGIAPFEHVLDLLVGSIARKPAVVEDRIEPREILNLTVIFDHDMIDGAPATRFTRRLVELITNGNGLDDTSDR
jgi:pyruvate/2-oxoglutarate dehydrogenase complex dihydrolipoamide acyltransferase (E2) component